MDRSSFILMIKFRRPIGAVDSIDLDGDGEIVDRSQDNLIANNDCLLALGDR